MLRPNVRKLLKTDQLKDVVAAVEKYIEECNGQELYLASIDLLRLYGKSLDSAKFYSLGLYLTTKIKNPAIWRELARYSYFIDKDPSRAQQYAKMAIDLNAKEGLWVYYIAKVDKDYFEEVYDNILLTSIPKNASTSLKTMMLKELHGMSDFNPHSIFGNPFFKTNDLTSEKIESSLKLLSIREPVSRFLSYYNKNVIEEKSLKEELDFTDKEQEFGFPLEPDFEFFLDNLNYYCYLYNDVLHHVLPQTAYFSNLSQYDCAADISESYKLEKAVSERVGGGLTISLPKKMVSSRSIESLGISDISKDKIRSLFDDDIVMYQEKSKYSKKFSFDFSNS